MTITVYTKPSCVQCDWTKRLFDRNGTPYQTIDITTDPAAYDLIRELGYMQAPVVTAGTDHWSGFRPDKINGHKKAA